MPYRGTLSAIARLAGLAALVGAGAVGCASDEDAPLPLEKAARVRDLQFLSTPRVKRMTREQYIAEQEEKARTDDGQTAAKYLRATMGRLGFFAPSFDLMRGTTASASNVGAFYSAKSDTITLFQTPREETVIHELVHALQDQHFDLEAFDEVAGSTDEFLAQRALIEGDATLAEVRVLAPDDTAGTLARAMTRSELEDWSEEIIRSQPNIPLYFSAYPSFAYPFGAAYVASVVGLYDSSPRLSWRASDELFRRRAPDSTQEVLRGGRGVDPIVSVGLDRLPTSIADRYEVEYVDRLGEWYIRLLTRPLGTFDKSAAWDGDQLVFIKPRGGEVPTALVWTTAWDDADAARAFAAALVTLHQGTAAPEQGPNIYSDADEGESFIIDIRGTQVVLVKNLAPLDLMVLADAALSPVATPLRVQHRWEAVPIPGSQKHWHLH